MTTPEAPEPLDDPEERELQIIAAIQTREDAARYLMSHGFSQYDATDFVFSLLRAIRRSL